MWWRVLQLTRAAEWEAARAAVRETDETAAVKVAGATFKSYLEKAIKNEPDAPTAQLAAELQQQEMARAAKAEAAVGPSRAKTETEKAAEFEKMLDESREKFERENPPKVYSTWSEWLGALLYQVRITERGTHTDGRDPLCLTPPRRVSHSARASSRSRVYTAVALWRRGSANGPRLDGPSCFLRRGVGISSARVCLAV
jgi:hypothetical protein